MLKLKSVLLVSLLSLFVWSVCHSQSASVSPSRLYYEVPSGEYRTQTIKVTNNGQKDQSFTVSFGDFEPKGMQGKSELKASGESPNSCSRWLSASPGFFTLKPGESKDVQVIMQVPNDPDANRVKWATMLVKLASERTKPLDAENQMGLGIQQTFQFVVHIFQTPPNVTFKSAKILHFKDISVAADSVKRLEMLVENNGDAIVDCASYIELTNLATGTNERLDIKAFTILPGSRREVVFTIPAATAAGLYSVLGVVDYGSREAIEAAEIELRIQ